MRSIFQDLVFPQKYIKHLNIYKDLRFEHEFEALTQSFKIVRECHKDSSLLEHLVRVLQYLACVKVSDNYYVCETSFVGQELCRCLHLYLRYGFIVDIQLLHDRQLIRVQLRLLCAECDVACVSDFLKQGSQDQSL